jgi:hypothetical protein
VLLFFKNVEEKGSQKAEGRLNSLLETQVASFNEYKFAEIAAFSK